MSTPVTSNNQRAQLHHRLKATTHQSANQKPPRRLEMRRLESDKENKTRGEMTAPPQARITPGPMISGQQIMAMAKKRNDGMARASKKIFPKSHIIAVTKRIIIRIIIPSQKISYSLGNRYVDDRWFENCTLATCSLHLLFDPIPGSARRDQSLDQLRQRDQCNNLGLCSQVRPNLMAHKRQGSEDWQLAFKDPWNDHCRVFSGRQAWTNQVFQKILLIDRYQHGSGPKNAFFIF